MTVLKGKIYINVESIENSIGKVVGFRPVSVTQSPSKAKGIPIELELEIDSAVFEPLKISGGTVSIAAPAASAVGTTPPPPQPPVSPTTAYGRALERAQQGRS